MSGSYSNPCLPHQFTEQAGAESKCCYGLLRYVISVYLLSKGRLIMPKKYYSRISMSIIGRLAGNLWSRDIASPLTNFRHRDIIPAKMNICS